MLSIVDTNQRIRRREFLTIGSLGIGGLGALTLPTLFAASNQAHVSRVEDAKQSLDEWMRTAWNHYQRICGGGPLQPGRS